MSLPKWRECSDAPFGGSNLQIRGRFIICIGDGACAVGHMYNVATAPCVDYRAIFQTLVTHVEQEYSINVNVGSVTGSYAGQFDGREIWVDLDHDPEEAVFILVHLFGH